MPVWLVAKLLYAEISPNKKAAIAGGFLRNYRKLSYPRNS